MSPEYIRRRWPEEERAAARERVHALAHAGRHPRVEFEEEDLRWAFDGRLEELEELVRVAESRIAAKQALPSPEERHALRRETDRVLDEWDEAERRERRERAEAEARARLGYDA